MAIFSRSCQNRVLYGYPRVNRGALAVVDLRGLGLDDEEDVDELRRRLPEVRGVVQQERVRVLHRLKVNQVVPAEPDRACLC
eukprot:7931055-Pyramimonas_sp.AAC.1